MKYTRALFAMAALMTVGRADPLPETRVGFIWSGQARLLQKADGVSKRAVPGSLLHLGDVLQAITEPVEFIYCPDKLQLLLQPGRQIVLRDKHLPAQQGVVAKATSVEACAVSIRAQIRDANSNTIGGYIPRELRTNTRSVRPPPATAPSDLSQTLNSAVQHEAAGELEAALAEYRQVQVVFKDAVWVRAKIINLEAKIAGDESGMPRFPSTYAILIGISRYQRLPRDKWLSFAHTDAEEFAQTLERFGIVSPDNTVLLQNEQATASAIHTALDLFVRGKAGRHDTVILFIAAHAVIDRNQNGYILAGDSDPEDLGRTAISMDELRQLFADRASNVGRLVAFLDVCHAGKIGPFETSLVASKTKELAQPAGVLEFLASGPKELSYEGAERWGGHGSFGFHLLEALRQQGRAGLTASQLMAELDRIPGETRGRQHPVQIGQAKEGMVLLPSQNTPPAPAVVSKLQEEFRQRITDKKLLPGPGSAYELLAGLDKELSPADFVIEQSRLRQALEETGQQTIFRYLAGEEAAMKPQDFGQAREYFHAAHDLAPDSLSLEAQEQFCRGRELLYDKSQRATALQLLDESAQLDPEAAYPVNAIGVAYLESADYDDAQRAFRAAIDRAPYWAYPLHNLALTYAEQGDYTAAVATYEQAVRLAPFRAYVPYNLGLLYHRLNRSQEAEQAFQRALQVSPQYANAYNGLGVVYSERGRVLRAEGEYREALRLDPELLPARHNLALLLTHLGRTDESIQLLSDNLKRSPQFLPSMRTMAELLATRPDKRPAIEEYLAVIGIAKEYPAALLALAQLYVDTCQTDAAQTHLNQADAIQMDYWKTRMLQADLQIERGQRTEAQQLLEQALALALTREDRKAVRDSFEMISKAPCKESKR
jgi:tetratricopeptide (TPR) repeat protein